MATSDSRSVARLVRSALGRDIFVPATSRLLWVPVHLLVFSLGVMMTRWWTNQGLTPLALVPVALLLGLSYAGLAFVGHETLHGALTHNKLLRRIVGFIGFAPFCISPRLWIAWHNRVHHTKANVAGRDPDAYPNLAEYERSAPTRLAVKWAAPRSKKWRGIVTLAIGFSVQSFHVLLFARKHRYMSVGKYVLCWLETLLAVAFWVAVGAFVGAEAFLFVYVLPIAIANAIVMAHIITNHSLNPLVEKNDPIATSLTVSVPKWFEFYSLGFGYHAEHHLFPAMSNRHAPRVQAELRRLVPDRYQEMPLSKALRLMFATPRVYASPNQLLDPDTGQIFDTLGPKKDEPRAQRHDSAKRRSASRLAVPRNAAAGGPANDRASTIPPPSAA